MKRWPIALAAACGFPAWIWLQISEPDKRLPDQTCAAVVDAWARLAELFSFHNLKNLWTELFRCDAQWWSKFTGFTWVSSAMIILALLIVIAALVRSRR